MRRMKTEETTEGLRLDYLMAASYYWYRAEGNDEQLVSTLNRMKAEKIAVRLQQHTPTPEEVKAFAISKFPQHKLHEDLR